MKLINKSLPKSEQISFIGWISECSTTQQQKQSYKWSQQYLIIKGGSVYIFKSPPNSLIENDSQLNHHLLTQSLLHYNCYQSVFRCVKSTELLDEKRHCFIIQCAEEPTMKYFSTENAEDLNKLKTSWHRANYHSVTQLGVSLDSNFVNK